MAVHQPISDRPTGKSPNTPDGLSTPEVIQVYISHTNQTLNALTTTKYPTATKYTLREKKRFNYIDKRILGRKICFNL